MKHYDIHKISYDSLKGKDVQIIQYPINHTEPCTATGQIKQINLYHIIYNIPTDFCSSGSPIYYGDSPKVLGMHKGAYKPKNDIGKYKRDLYNNIESEETMQENSNITKENEIKINNCGFLIYPIADSIINDLQYIKKEEENDIYEGEMKSDEK